MQSFGPPLPPPPSLETGLEKHIRESFPTADHRPLTTADHLVVAACQAGCWNDHLKLVLTDAHNPYTTRAPFPKQFLSFPLHNGQSSRIANFSLSAVAIQRPDGRGRCARHSPLQQPETPATRHQQPDTSNIPLPLPPPRAISEPKQLPASLPDSHIPSASPFSGHRRTAQVPLANTYLLLSGPPRNLAPRTSHLALRSHFARTSHLAPCGDIVSYPVRHLRHDQDHRFNHGVCCHMCVCNSTFESSDQTISSSSTLYISQHLVISAAFRNCWSRLRI